MKEHKRNNWTNQEVIEFVRGLMLDQKDSCLFSYNEGLERVIETFYDFDRPTGEWGCMAYDPELKEIVSIGNGIPLTKTGNSL